jgi:beta-glucosidase
VLFGDYNSAGRLPVSIPVSVGQLPVYYNYQNSARHAYVEGSAKPLYSFGYGLSYTTFDFANLSTQKTEDKGRLSVMFLSLLKTQVIKMGMKWCNFTLKTM